MILYLTIIVLSLVLYLFFRSKKKISLENEHCLITGGSSGIGLAIAVQAAKLGANVTIVARSKERLEVAKQHILASVKSSEQKVLTFSEDISKEVSLFNMVAVAEDHSGPITLLINCAGTSISSRFEDTPFSDFKKMLDINYLGSVNMTQAVLPGMKKRRCGRIAFVSSLAGLVGLYGYTAYSGSKFALVGLAEALQMEVTPFNISVTVSFPPDTDTPGFAEEIKSKPLETARISESAGLYSAEDVAIKTLNDVLRKKFMSSVGFEGWMLCTLGSSMTPVNSIFELIIQAATMGVFRIAAFVYLKQCDNTIEKCATENSSATKKD